MEVQGRRKIGRPKSRWLDRLRDDISYDTHEDDGEKEMFFGSESSLTHQGCLNSLQSRQ